jgi:DNA-binding CsgD family transcriptional regulator
MSESRGRGRPPHPDVLTPREWEVLSLLREGLTNRQIAERLSISQDAAKYHVGEILSKLGVATREEAATWQPVPPREGVARPAWASAAGPLGAFLRRVSPLGRVALAGAAAAVLAGLAILAWSVLQADERDGDGSGQAISGTATTAPSGSATLTPGEAITFGDPIGFPPDVAMIIEAGCYGCDGPASGLLRVYSRLDGSIGQNVLFTPEQLDLPPDDDDWEPYVLSYANRPDGSSIAIALCVTGYCGGLGPAAAGAAARLYQSQDGGITWSDAGEWPLDHYIVGMTTDGSLFTAHQTNISDKPDDAATPGPAPTPVFEYTLQPAGTPVEPPAGVAAGTFPLVTSYGDVFWDAGDGRFIDGAGQTVLKLPPGSGLAGVYGDPKSGFVVDWWTDRDTPDARHHLSSYEGNAPLAEAAVKTFDLAGAYEPGFWDTKAGLLYGSVEIGPAGVTATPLNFGLVPATLDFATGTMYPIPSPFTNGTSALPNVRNYVVALQRGPFARVTGTGSCLNLRAEPAEDAQVLTCLADGVLLLDVAPASHLITATPAPPWAEVIAPGGVHGFVNGEFVER